MIFYLREEKANQGGKAYGSIRHTLHPHYNWMCPGLNLERCGLGSTTAKTISLHFPYLRLSN